jgi:hypothetical protein
MNKTLIVVCVVVIVSVLVISLKYAFIPIVFTDLNLVVGKTYLYETEWHLLNNSTLIYTSVNLTIKSINGNDITLDIIDKLYDGTITNRKGIVISLESSDYFILPNHKIGDMIGQMSNLIITSQESSSFVNKLRIVNVIPVIQSPTINYTYKYEVTSGALVWTQHYNVGYYSLQIKQVILYHLTRLISVY